MFSKRLEVLSKYICPYKQFADIGCDHGYLIIESIINNGVEFAYGIDNKKGPLNNAKNNMEKFNISEDKYKLILSNGIKDLPQDIKCIVIAGMGTDNIKSIISSSLNKLDNIDRIITDSHRNLGDLRNFMAKHNYSIVNEEILLEDNKYYEIIVFEKSLTPVIYSSDEIEFGPILLQKKNKIFISKWENELIKLKDIYDKCFSESVLEKIERIKKIL